MVPTYILYSKLFSFNSHPLKYTWRLPKIYLSILSVFSGSASLRAATLNFFGTLLLGTRFVAGNIKKNFNVIYYYLL